MSINVINNPVVELLQEKQKYVYQVLKEEPLASAFAVDKNILVTSLHALRSCRDEDSFILRGEFPSQKEKVQGKLIDQYPPLDLAFLCTQEEVYLSSIKTPSQFYIGEIIFPIARTGADVNGFSAVSGMISKVRERVEIPSGGILSPYIESDASLPRGFEGGPLLHGGGSFIGMNSPLPKGIGMTIPLETIHEKYHEISQMGKSYRLFLGVNTIPVSIRGDEEQDSAVMITEIAEDSPASRAYLMQGDIILKIGDTSVIGVKSLKQALRVRTAEKPKRSYEERLRILRAGDIIDKTVSLGVVE